VPTFPDHALDHDELDLAIFERSCRKGIARHLFDDRPVCQQLFLCLYLGWKPRLQNAAVPRVPIGNLKRYRLGSLADLLCGGLGKFAHKLFLCEAFALVANETRSYRR